MMTGKPLRKTSRIKISMKAVVGNLFCYSCFTCGRIVTRNSNNNNNNNNNNRNNENHQHHHYNHKPSIFYELEVPTSTLAYAKQCWSCNRRTYHVPGSCGSQSSSNHPGIQVYMSWCHQSMMDKRVFQTEITRAFGKYELRESGNNQRQKHKNITTIFRGHVFVSNSNMVQIAFAKDHVYL